MITFHSGLFDVTMTEEGVKQMYEDVNFLEDAVLSLLNPKVVSDLDFTPEQYKEYLEDYFLSKKGRYSKHFLNEIFNKYQTA